MPGREERVSQMNGTASRSPGERVTRVSIPMQNQLPPDGTTVAPRASVTKKTSGQPPTPRKTVSGLVFVRVMVMVSDSPRCKDVRVSVKARVSPAAELGAKG